MRHPLLWILGSVVLLGLAGYALLRPEPPRSAAGLDPGVESRLQPLIVYCAASNRAAFEAVRTDYEKESGRAIQVQYGPSQTLLASMEVNPTGDLFIPADASYLKTAADKELIAEVIPLAKMRGVIAVRKGNPLAIKGIDDLLRSEVRLVQANPDAAAIGHLTREVLTKSERWTALQEATRAFRTTVTDVANDLVVGAADAGIVFDAILQPYGDLEAIQTPELDGIEADVSVAVISNSKQATAALHFARYLSARDRGLRHYEQQGFHVVKGDRWEDRPEVTIYAGSMLRPAIEDTIVAFEAREGVKVSRVYNGCGILVAQMKSGRAPDAYFACDREFMNQVPDLFPHPVDVSENRLVILVKKGNPHQLRDLKDLARPGLRVGIGHEKQCAMGWLTQNTFKEGGVQKEVMENVVVQTPTGDMLVNQMQTGALDAAVAYLSNAAGSGDFLDAIPIDGIPCSIATQPFGISKDTEHRQTALRLFQRICSAESQSIFLAEGFEWKADPQRAAQP